MSAHAGTKAVGDAKKLLLCWHVHCCLAGDRIVLLDTRRGRYCGVPATATALSRFIEGWPEQSVDAVVCALDHSRACLSVMLSTGMLTNDEKRGRPAFPCALQLPTLRFYTPALDVDPWTSASGLWHAALACCLARKTLKNESLWLVQERITGLRARAARREVVTHSRLDIERCLEEWSFLRPLFISSRRKCLTESLSLLEFLFLRGIYDARLVFGVTSSPFKAHCWLQSELEVWNDSPEFVRRFTPVMAM